MDTFGCEKWNDEGDKLVVRIVTSFATTYRDVSNLIKFIEENAELKN